MLIYAVHSQINHIQLIPNTPTTAQMIYQDRAQPLQTDQYLYLPVLVQGSALLSNDTSNLGSMHPGGG